MPQIFSAEQIRLNGTLLTGNGGKLFYNGAELGLAGGSYVSTSTRVIAGSGLVDAGSDTLASNITLNINPNSGLWANADQVGINYDNTSITITGGKLAVGSISEANITGTIPLNKITNHTQIVLTTGDQTVAGNKTFSNNIVIQGDLTVQGTTTTVNSETVTIADNIILLNSDVAGAPSQDAGIEINRGSSTNAQILWNETNDRWEAGISGAKYNVVTENYFQAKSVQLALNESFKSVSYGTIAGTPVVNATIRGTGASYDLIGCMVSGTPGSTSATIVFTAPIPANDSYRLDVIAASAT